MELHTHNTQFCVMLVVAVCSVRLLQATSAAFTGGAAVLPPVQAEVTEQTPLLQDRRRRQVAWHKAMQPRQKIVAMCRYMVRHPAWQTKGRRNQTARIVQLC